MDLWGELVAAKSGDAVNWLGVVGAAAGVAGAVSAVLSFAITMWLRHREAPEADWTVRGQGTYSHYKGEEGTRYLEGHIANAGDGAAFRIEVTGKGCTAELHRTASRPVRAYRVDHEPLARAGDEFAVFVRCDPGEEWNDAAIVVTWTKAPTRLRKRVSTVIPLKEIAPRPDASDPDEFGGIG